MVVHTGDNGGPAELVVDEELAEERTQVMDRESTQWREVAMDDRARIFQEELERQVELMREELMMEHMMNCNEFMYGSAYGPWPPQRPFEGLTHFLHGGQ